MPAPPMRRRPAVRTSSRAGQSRALPRLIWAAAWVSFFADFSTELIYGVLPAFYLRTLSLSILSLGLIEGVAESLVALTKLFSGTLSDRTGRRPLWMFVGYGLSVASKPLIALVSSGVAVGVLRAVDRFGKGVRGAPRDALVAQVVDERDAGRAFGVQRALDHAGALVGGLIAAGLLSLSLVQPAQLFLLSAIPGAAALLIIALFVREPRRKAAAQPAEALRRPFSIVEAWRRASPGLRWSLLPLGVFALANSSDMLLLAIAYERFLASGYPEAIALGQLPLLWALLHVVKSAGSAWGGALSDRVGRVGLLRAGWLIYAGVYAMAAWLALGGPPLLAWAVFAIYGVFTALAEAPERALVADLSSAAERRGSAYGLVHFTNGALALPATALASALWMWAGPAWAFGVGAALALLAAALFGAVRSRVQTESSNSVFSGGSSPS